MHCIHETNYQTGNVNFQGHSNHEQYWHTRRQETLLGAFSCVSITK